MKETQERLAYPFDEGCGKLGLSRTQGYRMVRRGELRTYMDGRRRMITRKALEEYIARRERESEGRAAA